MAIETWNGPLSGIDNTYGYNDMLLVPGGASMPVSVRDRLTEADGSGTVNPSGAITDADAERVAMAGDRLFRLPNGGLLLRRSVFTDACMAGNSRPNNSLLMTEPMARALAFFGASYQGSDPSGDLWCKRSVPGTAGTIETPWDASSMNSLRSIEEVLGRIRAVRSGNLPSDLQPAQHALARELAAAVPDAELKSFAADIAARRERLESAGDLFMRHPVLHTLGIAVLFGLGTDIYHVARYALFGGEAPWRGEGKGVFTRLYRKATGKDSKDPKDPPEGGGGGGLKELPTLNVKDIPQDAKVVAGFVVQNGKTIGKAVFAREVTSESVPQGQVVSGEINTHGDEITVVTPAPDFGNWHDWENDPTRVWEALPDGVVPLDEGAFIHRYQATVDGEIVGLSESVARNLAVARGVAFDANSFFFAGDFPRGEFLQLARGAAPTPSPTALFAGGDLNYGSLGYAQSTRTAVGLPHSVATPNFRTGAVPLTFGSGQAATFRAPSLVIRPALVPAR